MLTVTVAELEADRPQQRAAAPEPTKPQASAAAQSLGLTLAELVARCEAAGARQMLAVIGDAANAGSIGVHAALGFDRVGVVKSCGWKFDRWLDIVLMEKTLGEGDSTRPE